MNFYKETKIVCYTIPFFNVLADHTECHHLRQLNVPCKLKRNHNTIISTYLYRYKLPVEI